MTGLIHFDPTNDFSHHFPFRFVPSRIGSQMRLERHHPPTRREAWMRMGQFCSAAALWSSDLPVPVVPTMGSGTTNAWAVPEISSPSDEFTLVTQLGKSRISAIPDASLLRQHSLPLPTSKDEWIFSKKQPIYFPQFLFGAWNVTATLRQRLQIPQCDDVGASVDPNDFFEMDPRSIGDESHQVQFFATLANS
jgi:hypothetical protein